MKLILKCKILHRKRCWDTNIHFLEIQTINVFILIYRCYKLFSVGYVYFLSQQNPIQYFSGGQWILFDTVQQWQMAECDMNTNMYKSLYETNAEHSVTQVERKVKRKSLRLKAVKHIPLYAMVELDLCLTYFILKEINNKVDILTSIIDVTHISWAKFCFRNDIMAHKIKKQFHLQGNGVLIMKNDS